ncbi:MAG: helix-hairpin-helix domain-containing protein [Bacteroidales bacterium]
MKSFFHLSKGEFIAACFILLLIMTSFLFYGLYNHGETHKFDFSDFKTEVIAFEKQQNAIADSLSDLYNDKKKQWEQAKSNRFHYSYSDSTWKKGYYFDDSTFRKKQPLYTIIKIDLNHCDTSDIIKIPQFGSKRAQKIIEYREQLGGYYNFAQLNEIYILQNIQLDYIDKYFTLDSKAIRKIKINEADYKELISHPYFDAYLTKSVLHYRNKYGKIKDLNEFQRATNAYHELLKKIESYLEF